MSNIVTETIGEQTLQIKHLTKLAEQHQSVLQHLSSCEECKTKGWLKCAQAKQWLNGEATE